MLVSGKQIDTREIPPVFWSYIQEMVQGKRYADLAIKIHDYHVTLVECNQKKMPLLAIGTQGNIVLVETK
jgi:hypothetical protein